jgi:hypothetical protein
MPGEYPEPKTSDVGLMRKRSGRAAENAGLRPTIGLFASRLLECAGFQCDGSHWMVESRMPQTPCRRKQGERSSRLWALAVDSHLAGDARLPDVWQTVDGSVSVGAHR